MENKFREFKMTVDFDGFIPKLFFNNFVHANTFKNKEQLHVIEIEAVEQLKAENEKAYDALAGNICGYCWQKMEDEPTVKQTHQEYANQLLAEISALKSKLEIAKKGLEFYGDRESYVEDQEFHTIDSLNNDDEFLEKYQARVGGKTARQALKEIEG